MAVPVSALQEINPGAVIELFTLELNQTLHGSNTIYRFHNGANLNANGEVVWNGNNYQRFPIQCEGFEYTGTGTLPRPIISVSNILGTLTTIMQDVNQTTVGNDLNGAKLTRIRTLARFLDAVNFAPQTVTSTSTQTVVDSSDVETVTYTVTVHNPGSGNIFRINGVNNPVITMKRGSTYIFNLADGTNATHPLRIKSDAGGEQTTTVSGTPGQAGATVTYQPAYPGAPSDLRYYCSTHGNAMGNTITMNNPNTVQQTTTCLLYTSPSPRD